MLNSTISLFRTLIISVCCHSAYADIYEYIDEAGITHYSDVPNNGIDGNDNYVLILKSEVEVKPEVAKAEAVADNPNTTASTNSEGQAAAAAVAALHHCAVP